MVDEVKMDDKEALLLFPFPFCVLLVVASSAILQVTLSASLIVYFLY